MGKGANIAKVVAEGVLAGIEVTATVYDNIHFGGEPVVSGIWNVTSSMVGKGMELRQDKALEWSAMLNNMLPKIKEEVLRSEEFQDTFITSFEWYIRERDAEKRVILRNIFMDYTAVASPTDYPIERFYEITRQITIKEAKTLSRLISEASAERRRRMAIKPEPSPLARNRDGGGWSAQPLSVSITEFEDTLHLISLALLIQDSIPAMISNETNAEGIRIPRVFISDLGYKYEEFMKDLNLDGQTKIPTQ